MIIAKAYFNGHGDGDTTTFHRTFIQSEYIIMIIASLHFGDRSFTPFNSDFYLQIFERIMRKCPQNDITFNLIISKIFSLFTQTCIATFAVKW